MRFGSYKNLDLSETLTEEQAELQEALNNIELIRPLLPTLTKLRARSLGGVSGPLRGTGGLGAIGPNSETKVIATVHIPPIESVAKAADAKKYNERDANEIAALTIHYDIENALEKKILTAATNTSKAKDANGNRPFATVFVVDNKTVGMLWNNEQHVTRDTPNKGYRNNDEKNFVGTNVTTQGVNTSASWMYARSDALWSQVETKQRKVIGANKLPWEKRFYKWQVTNVTATKNAILLNVVYELVRAVMSDGGGTVQVYGIYPDLESFDKNRARRNDSALKGGTEYHDQNREKNLATNMKTELATAASAKMFQSKLDDAMKEVHPYIERFNASLKAAMADPDHVTQTPGSRQWTSIWSKVESDIDKMKFALVELRKIASAIEERKKKAVAKSASPGSHVATSKIYYTDEDMQKSLDALRSGSFSR